MTLKDLYIHPADKVEVLFFLILILIFQLEL